MCEIFTETARDVCMSDKVGIDRTSAMEASSMCYALLYFHGCVFIVTCVCAFILRKPIMTVIQLVTPIVRARLNATPGSYVYTAAQEDPSVEELSDEELPPHTGDDHCTGSEIDAAESSRKKLKFI